MKQVENECVGCETCTMGFGCPMLQVTSYTCDTCGDEAEYSIDDYDLCESCAYKYLNWLLNDVYSVQELAKLVDVECKTID